MYHSSVLKSYASANIIHDTNFVKDSWRFEKIIIDVYNNDLPSTQKRKQEQSAIENQIQHFAEHWKIHRKLIDWDFWLEFSDSQSIDTESSIDTKFLTDFRSEFLVK